jgi:hypothetical protein
MPVSKRILLLLGALLVGLLTGCMKSAQETVEDTLELRVKLTMKEPGEVSISAGLYNSGRFEYPGTENYNGFLTILDENGKLRALGEMDKISLLAAGETFYPLTYNLAVEPGVYRLKFGALDKPPIEMQFEIVEKNGTLYMTAPGEFIDPLTEYTNAS